MAPANDEPLYGDFDGVRYRVYDTSFSAGRHRRLLLGSPRANYRVFVAAGGERRAYRIKRGERPGRTTAELERQFRETEYLGTTRFDPTTHGPR
jgi:hypothetical protein